MYVISQSCEISTGIIQAELLLYAEFLESYFPAIYFQHFIVLCLIKVGHMTPKIPLAFFHLSLTETSLLVGYRVIYKCWYDNYQ